MRKRKTKLAQADGCAMRFRSAWKKTPVPAPAAPRKAIRNCVEESSPTSGHGTGKPSASPSEARSTAARRQQSNCGHERDPGSTARPAPACCRGAARRAARRPATRRSPRRRGRVGPRDADRRLGRDRDPRRHRRDARPAQGSDLDLEVAPCRRLVNPSCPPSPPTTVELIKRRGAALGPTVVMVVGYNDFEDDYASEIDDTLAAFDAASRQAHLLAHDERATIRIST